MKTIIILLLALLMSCGSYETEKAFCKKGKITVLKKESASYGTKVGVRYVYKMYLYNGTEALWYETDANTYNSYNINDTLPTIVLTIIKREK